MKWLSLTVRDTRTGTPITIKWYVYIYPPSSLKKQVRDRVRCQRYKKQFFRKFISMHIRTEFTRSNWNLLSSESILYVRGYFSIFSESSKPISSKRGVVVWHLAECPSLDLPDIWDWKRMSSQMVIARYKAFTAQRSWEPSIGQQLKVSRGTWWHLHICNYWKKSPGRITNYIV